MSARAGVPALVPMRFETLLAWALASLAADRTVFGLPRRAMWASASGLDLSVSVPGGRVATPLGVAAGPHTQLAHNIVVSWLAGARVLELKTVQVLDQLEIPRPCIDAPGEGYNVEWSQELALAESLEQYVAAWALVHALAPRVLGAGAAAALAGTRFDASVGYDLAGIRSAAVARFLDGLRDASALLARVRDRLPAALRAGWPAAVPAQITDTVTLSSFHGCPADEIGDIVEHLFVRHGLNVVIKLNPTLLGYDAVDALLHGPLGWRDVTLERAAFERDLQWPHALELLARLRASARRHGRTLGVKLTNTLVVRNTRGRLAGDAVYLSGPPLHPIAMQLAERLHEATAGVLPMALSAGVNAENFADAVACGFTPVTTCTDLLRPTGYRRLPRYLKALEADMVRTGTSNVDAYVNARARECGAPGVDARLSALANLSAHAARVADDARYRASTHAAADIVRPPLALLDCESCNQCTLVCPNGAFFDVPSPPRPHTPRAGEPPAPERQWVLLADLCNECGNCETFCPQAGGPYRIKARFHSSRAAWQADASAHAVLVESTGRRIVARQDGCDVVLERDAAGWRPCADADEPAPGGATAAIATGAAASRASSGILRTLAELTDQALTEVNPLSALCDVPGTTGH